MGRVGKVRGAQIAGKTKYSTTHVAVAAQNTFKGGIMGFWDKAFQVAKDVGTNYANSISEKANEVRQTKEKYESMSDEELIRIVNSDGFFGKTQTEKGVAFSILKSRGYSADDIRSR